MGFVSKALKHEILEVVTPEEEDEEEEVAEEEGRESEGFKESEYVGMMEVRAVSRQIGGFIWPNWKGIREDLSEIDEGIFQLVAMEKLSE